MSLEIPARGTPRKIQRNLDRLLLSNTSRTEFRINVAVISFHGDRIGFGVRETDQMTSKYHFTIQESSLLRGGREKSKNNTLKTKLL